MTGDPAANDNKYIVPALAQGLGILSLFGPDRRSVTAPEMSCASMWRSIASWIRERRSSESPTDSGLTVAPVSGRPAAMTTQRLSARFSCIAKTVYLSFWTAARRAGFVCRICVSSMGRGEPFPSRDAGGSNDGD